LSALEKTGISQLMKSVDDAYAAAMAKLPTPKLTRALIDAVEFQQPRRRGPIRPKLRYAHQGGQNPPIIVSTEMPSTRSPTPINVTSKAASEKLLGCGDSIAHRVPFKREPLRGQRLNPACTKRFAGFSDGRGALVRK
jgi:hypothetical protein